MLPFQHIARLQRHINRQLAEWAWQLDTAGSGSSSSSSRARCVGAASALAIPLWLWGAHHIINCQYGSDKAATQQQLTSSSSSEGSTGSSEGSTGYGDCIATDVDVTMSKAATRGDKCFYNCQMALATLWGRHASNSFLYLDQGVDNVQQQQQQQQRDDEDDREDDGNVDDAGNIASVAEFCDDLTAAAAATATAATAPLKRQHQQLSATLAKVGVAVSPDQRLLMTWHELAVRAVRILC